MCRISISNVTRTSFVPGTAQEQLKARDAVNKAKQRAREAKALRRQEEEREKNRLDKIHSYMQEKVRIVRPRRRRRWRRCSRYPVGTPEELGMGMTPLCIGVDHTRRKNVQTV